MTISKIYALHVSDPVAAREKIIATMRKCLGNAELTAQQLDCNYRTIYRLVQSDKVLAKEIKQLRLELEKQGVTQVGWNNWHRGTKASRKKKSTRTT